MFNNDLQKVIFRNEFKNHEITFERQTGRRQLLKILEEKYEILEINCCRLEQIEEGIHERSVNWRVPLAPFSLK